MADKVIEEIHKLAKDAEIEIKEILLVKKNEYYPYAVIQWIQKWFFSKKEIYALFNLTNKEWIRVFWSWRYLYITDEG